MKAISALWIYATRSVWLTFLIVVAALMTLSCRRGEAKSNCIVNLKQIEGAKATWALEHKKNNDDIPMDSDLFGQSNYIRDKPLCPAGGVYTLGQVSEAPRCSIPQHSLELGHFYVVTETGLPITGATMILLSASNQAKPTQTDTNGFARLDSYEWWVTGATSVVVSSPGFVAVTFDLTVATNRWPAKLTLREGTTE